MSILALRLASDPQPPKRPSRALIAMGPHHGCLLEWDGSDIEYEVEQIGSLLDDLGLDDAPSGLSIWEGEYVYTPGRSTPDGYSDPDVQSNGVFRDLTSEEWEKVRLNEDLWPCMEEV